MFRRAVSAALLSVLSTLPVFSADELWALFGSQRNAPGIGVSVARFDVGRGAFDPAQLRTESLAPSFLALSADGKLLYTCNATGEFLGAPGGGLSAYRFDARSGTLAPLNSANSGGAGACFVGFDRSGKFLLTANYSGGSAAVFAIESDGRIGARTSFVQHEGRGPHPDRQKSPHPHSAWADPSNRFVLVPDLGLDRVFVYRFDAAAGTLASHAPAALVLPPASGPRHLAWAKDGTRAYLLCELSNELVVANWDATTGVFTPVQTTSTLPAGFAGTNTAGEVMVSPDGRFVYATNRGNDSLAVFAIEPPSGRISLVEHVGSGGKFPRNLAFAGDGRWLLVTNHNSDNAAVFAVDRASGKLTPHGAPLAVPYPFGLALRAVEAK